MTLYFCAWDEDDGPCSLVVDAKTEDNARFMARDVAEGIAPKRVVPIEPGVFVAEVVERKADDGDDEDDEDVEILLAPLDHVVDMLVLLDDAATTAPRAVALDAPACGAEAADDDGKTWKCVLVEDHAGDHRAADGERWSD